MCPQLERTTYWDFVNQGKQTVLAFLDPYTDARTTEFKAWLCATAKASTRYRFAWMDAIKHDKFLSGMSVTLDDVPVLLVLDPSAKVHYVKRNTTWTREQFLEAVEQNKVPPEGEGTSWWAWFKSHILTVMVVSATHLPRGAPC
jgi:hypothetical protein